MTCNKFLIVDLEATCWDTKPYPDGMVSEIIEYGLCEIDLNTLTILDNYSILVKPEFSTVSEFCTKLTGHTQENLDANGIDHFDALDILSSKYYNVSWGSYGMYVFNMIYDYISIGGDGINDMPFGRNYFNIKYFVSLMLNLNHGIGMSKALKRLGLELEGTHHSGKDDAYNIAKIWIEILKKLRG